MSKWTRNERRQAYLLGAAFLLGFLGVVLNAAPVKRFVSIGWMALPVAWLLCCAEGELRRRKGGGISVGLGTLACLLSCVMLLTAPEGTLENWKQLILPAAVIAAPVIGLMVWRVRKASLKKLVAMGLAVLCLYAPGTAMCLNQLLPPAQTEVQEASLSEVSSEYGRGNWTYFAVIEHSGVENMYEVSREDYLKLQEGAAVSVVRTCGRLGIDYLEIQVS